MGGGSSQNAACCTARSNDGVVFQRSMQDEGDHNHEDDCECGHHSCGGPRPRPSLQAQISADRKIINYDNRECSNRNLCLGEGHLPSDSAEGKEGPKHVGRDCSTHSISSGFEPFNTLNHRSTNESVCKENLFGDKALREKVKTLEAQRGKAKAIEKTEAQIAQRLQVIHGDSVLSAVASEDGCPRCLEKWVQVLLSREEALKDVDVLPRTVTEACKEVLGSTSRPIEVHEVKMNYAKILAALDRLEKHRRDTVFEEVSKLETEVGEIEDLINLCFDKMDEDSRGVVTCEQLAALMCGEGTENTPMVVVSLEEATTLFNQMSKGEKEIDRNRFKDEITHVGLQVLTGNIAWRRNSHKRYRDHWYSF